MNQQDSEDLFAEERQRLKELATEMLQIIKESPDNEALESRILPEPEDLPDSGDSLESEDSSGSWDLPDMQLNLADLENETPYFGFTAKYGYYELFLIFLIENIEHCDSITFLSLDYAINFMMDAFSGMSERDIRTRKAREAAENSRPINEELHNEIFRIGKSVIQTNSERDVTAIVQRRLKQMGYSPSRRTIRDSLQKSRIIRTQAERKKETSGASFRFGQ